MKRMKGINTLSMAMESSPSLFPPVYEDHRIRLKHHSLMQDFQELYKETEVQKKQLEMLKEKKLILSAEVRFLRKRYMFLMQNKSQNSVPEPSHVQRQNMVNGGRNAKRTKHFSLNAAANTQHLPPRFDLNRKGKMCSEREPAFQSPPPNFDMNLKQKTFVRKEAVLRGSAAVPDLNQKERIYSGQEATARNDTPIFDLNQISREEQELETNGDSVRTEPPKMPLIRGASDEHLTDMKLSACRSVGTGSSRAGKRKISWQDQVALRV